MSYIFAAVVGALCLIVASADPAADLSLPRVMTLAIHGVPLIVSNHTIPNIPGKNVVHVLITYPPGGMTPSHTHAKSAFITKYVISGEIRSKVDNQPATIYRPGDVWIEKPGAHETLSENVSKTQGASFLATIILDTQETDPITILDRVV